MRPTQREQTIVVTTYCIYTYMFIVCTQDGESAFTIARNDEIRALLLQAGANVDLQIVVSSEPVP